MRAAVVYDSLYGNTEKIAQTVAEGMKAKMKCEAVPVSQAGQIGERELDWLIVGSPTQGGRPTAAMQKWLEGLPAGSLKNVKAAAFDTRLLESRQVWGLKMVMKMIGYAAPKIAGSLKAKGAEVVAAKGFVVNGKEGPLDGTEVSDAWNWVREMVAAA